MYDLSVPEIEGIERQAEILDEVTVTGVTVVFEGICKNCKEKKLIYREEKIMNIKGTRTEANLMAAFAGESQARNKYTYYASQARKEGYVQIANIFEETAANEKEHAKMWFKLLGGIETQLQILLTQQAVRITSGLICTHSSRRKREKRDSRLSPSCSRALLRLKRSMRKDTASFLQTLKADSYFQRTETQSGSVQTAATFISVRKLRMYVLCALILRHISSSKQKTINISFNF